MKSIHFLADGRVIEVRSFLHTWAPVPGPGCSKALPADSLPSSGSSRPPRGPCACCPVSEGTWPLPDSLSSAQWSPGLRTAFPALDGGKRSLHPRPLLPPVVFCHRAWHCQDCVCPSALGQSPQHPGWSLAAAWQVLWVNRCHQEDGQEFGRHGDLNGGCFSTQKRTGGSVQEELERQADTDTDVPATALMRGKTALASPPPHGAASKRTTASECAPGWASRGGNRARSQGQQRCCCRSGWVGRALGLS